MNRSGVDIQIVQITSAIRACWAAKGQRWRAAEFLFQMASRLGLQPDIATFASLAGAYRFAPVEKVVEVYDMTRESGLNPNEVFAEIYLTSALALDKEETGHMRTVSALTSHLDGGAQARLKAARTALNSFKAAGVKLSALCQKLDSALGRLGT